MTGLFCVCQPQGGSQQAHITGLKPLNTSNWGIPSRKRYEFAVYTQNWLAESTCAPTAHTEMLLCLCRNAKGNSPSPHTLPPHTHRHTHTHTHVTLLHHLVLTRMQNRIGSSSTVSTRAKRQSETAEIDALVHQVERMEKYVSQVSDAIYMLAQSVLSADLHVDISNVLWEVDRKQDRRNQTLENLHLELSNGRSSILTLLTRPDSETKHAVEVQSRIIQNQESDIDTLKYLVRKLHTLSQQHGSKIQQARQMLLRLLLSLDNTHKSLNTTKLKVAQLESLQRHAATRDKIIKILQSAKVDYETGLIRTAKGKTNVSVQQVREHTDGDAAGIYETSLSDPALLHVNRRLMLSILLLVGAAAMGGVVAHRGGFPHTLGYIAGGYIVGPSGLALVSDLHSLQTLAQIGSIFVFFSHGLRFREQFIHSSSSNDQSVLASTLLLSTAIAATTSSAVTGVCVLSGLTRTGVEAWVIGTAISSSSLSMAVSVFARGSPETNRIRVLTGGVAAFGDIFLSILLSVPTRIKHGDEALEAGVAAVARIALHSTLGFAVVVAVAFAVELSGLFGTKKTKSVVLPTRHLGDSAKQNHTTVESEAARAEALELSLLGGVAIAMATAILTKMVAGLSFEIGAFVSGLVIAKSKFISAASMGPLCAVFGGMLFASMGTIINASFCFNHLSDVIVLLIGVYTIKVISCLIVLSVFRSVTRLTPMDNMLSSSALSGIGELSLVFMAQAQSAQLVQRHNYLLFLVLVVASELVFPQAHRALVYYQRNRGSSKER